MPSTQAARTWQWAPSLPMPPISIAQSVMTTTLEWPPPMSITITSIQQPFHHSYSSCSSAHTGNHHHGTMTPLLSQCKNQHPPQHNPCRWSQQCLNDNGSHHYGTTTRMALPIAQLALAHQQLDNLSELTYSVWHVWIQTVQMDKSHQPARPSQTISLRGCLKSDRQTGRFSDFQTCQLIRLLARQDIRCIRHG